MKDYKRLFEECNLKLAQAEDELEALQAKLAAISAENKILRDDMTVVGGTCADHVLQGLEDVPCPYCKLTKVEALPRYVRVESSGKYVEHKHGAYIMHHELKEALE
jgi:hypothetical protein